MTRVVDSRPVLDFVQDLFEEPHVMVNVAVLCYTRQRPSIRNRNDSTRPPARRGVPGTPVPRNRRDRWGRKEK